MVELLKQMNNLVEEEYGRATKKYGAVNSGDHMSYAVIKEEYEEAEEDLLYAKRGLEQFWEAVKKNLPASDKEVYLRNLRFHAVDAACELVQVAAMAHKAIETLKSQEG